MPVEAWVKERDVLDVVDVLDAVDVLDVLVG